ncbi:MAG: NAD-dependent epimerase/dehydratase family protein [Candidatus Ratteibacteria bacterium]|nr:NAD-dependent epimerase/dehydratase family protein [Candidatus Ratteibacteria bacterium]
MRIMVTGGCGFIGSHLTDKLIEMGHNVCVVDNLSTGNIKNLNPEAHLYQMDIRDEKIKDVFEKEQPESVFHLAAQINVRRSEEDPFFDIDVNIKGSVNVIKAFLNVKDRKKFIFASTGGVMYGDTDIFPTPESVEPFPLCPYGISKLTVEKYLTYFSAFYNLQFVSLRYGNVYGPRQNAYAEAGVIAIFSTNILEGKKLTVFGDGEQTRDFVYIDDVIRANLIMLENPTTGIFNVGTGKETSVNQIFEYIKSASGKKIKKIHTDPKKGEIKRSCLCPDKIVQMAGWKAEIDIKDGIKRTFNWFKENFSGS